MNLGNFRNLFVQIPLLLFTYSVVSQFCLTCFVSLFCALPSYFSALILVEGMEIDSLHERVLDDRIEEHKFASNGRVRQVNVFCVL